ncbi:hypothetical protein CYMTET_22243, partial [Cymbomonas tetramitiformis]
MAEVHPWAGPVLAGWPASGEYPAHQRLWALMCSHALMLAGATLVHYERGAAICAEYKGFLGCDVAAGDDNVPFQVCAGAGSCEELFSRHLCAAHESCPDGFASSVQAVHEWQSAMCVALALTALPLIARDLPVQLVQGRGALQYCRPSSLDAAAEALHGAAGIAALLPQRLWGWSCEAAMVVRTRALFWWRTAVQRQSAWAVFQGLEAAEVLAELHSDATHVGGKNFARADVLRASEAMSGGDLLFYMRTALLSALCLFVMVHYGVWIHYLS